MLYMDTASATIKFYGPTTTSYSGNNLGLSVEMTGLPTGNQTVQIICGDRLGSSTTIKGTTDTARVFLTVEDYS